MARLPADIRIGLKKRGELPYLTSVLSTYARNDNVSVRRVRGVSVRVGATSAWWLRPWPERSGGGGV